MASHNVTPEQITSLEPEGVEMVAKPDNLRHIFNGAQHYEQPMQSFCSRWFEQSDLTPPPFNNSDDGMCGSCIELENRGGAARGVSV